MGTGQFFVRFLMAPSIIKMYALFCLRIYCSSSIIDVFFQFFYALIDYRDTLHMITWFFFLVLGMNLLHHLQCDLGTDPPAR